MGKLNFAGFILGSSVRKPSTRLYPFEKRANIKGTRGKITIEIEKCNHCSLCQLKCPTGAIKVDRVGKIWSIDRLKCILCGACVACCNRSALAMGEDYAAAITEKAVEVYGKPEDAPAPTTPRDGFLSGAPPGARTGWHA